MTTRSSRANPSDPRIPCPVCGQQIHPVAGRCKHCKTDLVKLREQHGQRAPRVDLGAVGSAPVAAAPPVFAPEPAPRPGPNGQNGHGPEIAPPAAFLATYPDTPAPTPARSSRWPILIVAIAGVAIVVCAYLLLFAKDESSAATPDRTKGVMPAPDRMDTMPEPLKPPVVVPDSADPWTAPSPTPPPAPPPSVTPSPPPSAGGAPPSAEEFIGEMFDTMCEKAAACGLDQAGVAACNLLSGSGITDTYREEIRAGRCAYDEGKAARCLEAIRAIPCTGGGLDLDQAMQSLTQIGDCSTALVCQ